VEKISSAGAAFLRFPCCFPVHDLSPTAAKKVKSIASKTQHTSLECLLNEKKAYPAFATVVGLHPIHNK
jgi:hypothetical protein